MPQINEYETKPVLEVGDWILLEDKNTGRTMKISAAAMRLFMLYVKAMGGSGSGDITTNNATQSLSNKTLLLPILNSGAAVIATGPEVNVLHGITIDTATLNRLAGLSGNIMTLLNSKVNTTQMANVAYFYHTTITATATTTSISEATIRAALGFSTYKRVGKQIMIQLQTGASPVSITTPSVSIYTETSGRYLERVDFTTTVGTVYHILITCAPLQYSAEA